MEEAEGVAETNFGEAQDDHRAGEEGAARLLQRLESYVEEYQDYLGADYMAELLERIRATNADAVATLDATLEGARFVARWNDELAEASRGDLAPATSRAALERVVAAVATGELSTEQVSGLDRGIMRCIRACSTLPAGLARSLLDLSGLRPDGSDLVERARALAEQAGAEGLLGKVEDTARQLPPVPGSG